MKDRIYLILDKAKVLRMVRTGPPKTAAGERFVAIDIEADPALWTPPKVQAITVKVGPHNTPAPPVVVDLASIPNVCHGQLLPKQTKDASGNLEVGYACTNCNFTTTWQQDKTPHWKFTKEAKK